MGRGKPKTHSVGAGAAYARVDGSKKRKALTEENRDGGSSHKTKDGRKQGEKVTAQAKKKEHTTRIGKGVTLLKDDENKKNQRPAP